MPELPEVEFYRRLAEAARDRPIAGVDAPDAWYVKGATNARGLSRALEGRTFTGTRRIGKLLLLDVDNGRVLGLRFGMTGRLVVDGRAGVENLIYSPESSSDQPIQAWDRFRVRFADGGDLRIRDPRRLGGVQLDPDEARLGVDVLGLSPAQLRSVLTGAAPLKTRLMDQARLAGVGNLIADETLWRAGLDPARPANSLSPNEVRRLHRHLQRTVAEMLEQGGSHTGDLLPHRQPGGACPKDGTPLVRGTIGGRTTWSCPAHQR